MVKVRARSQSDRHLTADRARCPPRRPEGRARHQGYMVVRPKPLGRSFWTICGARLGQAGASHRRWWQRSSRAALASLWDGMPVQRCTVHKGRNLRLPPKYLHDEVRADFNDMMPPRPPARSWPGATRSWPSGSSAAGRSRRAWKKPARACSPSCATRPSSGARRGPRTPLSACTRNKRRIKTRYLLPYAETAAMLFWALLASGQITMRQVDGWQTLEALPHRP